MSTNQRPEPHARGYRQLPAGSARLRNLLPSRIISPCEQNFASPGEDKNTALIDVELPHRAARGLAYFLILLFAAGVIASLVITVPETGAEPRSLQPVCCLFGGDEVALIAEFICGSG